MTKDQMRGECDRIQGLLDAYEARAVASSIEDRHDGLRKRLAAMQVKLAEADRA